MEERKQGQPTMTKEEFQRFILEIQDALERRAKKDEEWIQDRFPTDSLAPERAIRAFQELEQRVMRESESLARFVYLVNHLCVFSASARLTEE